MPRTERIPAEETVSLREAKADPSSLTRRGKFALHLDTSALLKLFVEEGESPRVRSVAPGPGR